MNKRRPALGFLLLGICGCLAAQEQPSFEVTSVKLNTSDSPGYSNFPLGPGDVYTSNGGRFTARNLTLTTYVFFAYRITGDQSQAVMSQLPGWANSDRFDIEAKTDGNPAKDTKNQMRLMMRSLLAERFGLKVHYETRQVPVFVMTLAKPGKTGPQLRAHPADSPCVTSASQTDAPAPNVDGGYPALCGGFLGMPPTVPGRLRLGARNVTMGFIASFLISNSLNRPVIDQTGLTGTFDVLVEWVPEQNDPPRRRCSARTRRRSHVPRRP